MMAYKDYLKSKEIKIHYVESIEARSDIRILIPELVQDGECEIHYIDPTDQWLHQRVKESLETLYIKNVKYENPIFINQTSDLKVFFRSDKKSFFQTSFYKQQRKKHQILIEDKDQPLGGKWTYDIDNRKKYPKDKTPPMIQFPESSAYWKEAVNYVDSHFSDHYGEIGAEVLYPITFKEAEDWWNQFLSFRFLYFGHYEDAIVAEHSILHHSVLSPLMNVGLILPQKLINESIAFANEHEIPINSLEGFVRQIMGWREFIRGMYECKGTFSRTQNYWGFKRKIPRSFYDGTTGIEPVDQTIKKVLKTGYCHHIERLMVLGNFMLLCEFDPDEVYRWFMELFIDAYDWVMVPNVYGMSQFADGGTFATKPYISGSNYLKKMSDYKKGPWQEIWDGLFWRFMHVHQGFFKGNPRLSMLLGALNRMSEEKRDGHFKRAERFLSGL